MLGVRGSWGGGVSIRGEMDTAYTHTPPPPSPPIRPRGLAGLFKGSAHIIEGKRVGFAKPLVRCKAPYGGRVGGQQFSPSPDREAGKAQRRCKEVKKGQRSSPPPTPTAAWGYKKECTARAPWQERPLWDTDACARPVPSGTKQK